MKSHTTESILPRLPKTLKKWVNDLDTVHLLAMLHILREQHATAALFGHAKNHGVPIREAVEAVQIDRCENVIDRWLRNKELGKDLNLASGQARVQFELLCDGDEVLLQDLERYDAGPLLKMLLDEVEGSRLLEGNGSVFGVDEDVGINE